MAATAAPPARSRPQLLGASYKAGARILRVVPPGLRHAAAGPGGAAWFWLSAAQRRAALDNYAAALGRERDDPEVGRVARRAFQNYGRMLMDFVLLDSLSREEVVARMAVDGREHLDAALRQGRGVILVLPHMGSWDMSAAYAAAIGYRVLAVTERFPGSLNDAVVESRGRFGMEIVPVGRPAVRSILERLESNGIVALVCDLEQGPGVAVSFFGRAATVPSGPASLAMKTGAVLLPIYQYATTRGRQQARIDTPVGVSEGDTKAAVMQHVIERFEGYIREHPDQWYAFRPMFRS